MFAQRWAHLRCLFPNPLCSLHALTSHRPGPVCGCVELCWRLRRNEALTMRRASPHNPFVIRFLVFTFQRTHTRAEELGRRLCTPATALPLQFAKYQVPGKQSGHDASLSKDDQGNIATHLRNHADVTSRYLDSRQFTLPAPCTHTFPDKSSSDAVTHCSLTSPTELLYPSHRLPAVLAWPVDQDCPQRRDLTTSQGFT
jgi:hypothetical protein